MVRGVAQAPNIWGESLPKKELIVVLIVEVSPPLYSA